MADVHGLQRVGSGTDTSTAAHFDITGLGGDSARYRIELRISAGLSGAARVRLTPGNDTGGMESQYQIRAPAVSGSGRTSGAMRFMDCDPPDVIRAIIDVDLSNKTLLCQATGYDTTTIDPYWQMTAGIWTHSTAVSIIRVSRNTGTGTWDAAWTTSKYTGDDH